MTDRGDDARLVWLEVGDDPEAWSAAGFAVEGDRIRLGGTTVVLTGRRDGARGVRRWGLSGLDVGIDLDGLPTVAVGPPSEDDEPPPGHPNGATGIDHVVVITPDLERTTAALGEVGLACRRVRETESYGAPMRQGFFRLGPVVLEVVSGDTGSGLPADEAPAGWFGLALDVDDLDASAALLGDGMGTTKDAVQPGRRIATMRHKALHLSVPVALMDHRAGR